MPQVMQRGGDLHRTKDCMSAFSPPIEPGLAVRSLGESTHGPRILDGSPFSMREHTGIRARGLSRFNYPVLDATIAEAAFKRVVAGNRIGTTIALSHQHAWIHAGLNQCRAHRVSALLR